MPELGPVEGTRVIYSALMVVKVGKRREQSAERWIERSYSWRKNEDVQICEHENVKWTHRQQNSQARLRNMRGDSRYIGTYLKEIAKARSQNAR